MHLPACHLRQTVYVDHEAVLDVQLFCTPSRCCRCCCFMMVSLAMNLLHESRDRVEMYLNTNTLEINSNTFVKLVFPFKGLQPSIRCHGNCSVFSVQCSVFSVQCSVFSVLCSVFSVQCSVFSVQCSVFSVLCSVFSVQCSVFSVQCSVFCVQCSVFSVQCSVFSVQCSVFSVQCSVFCVQCSVFTCSCKSI